MKTMKIFFLLAGVALVLTGCETYDGRPDRTANGALIGGAVGATTGAIIGNNSRGGHSGGGALIGGAVGAIAGGVIGHSMDQQERARLQAQAPQTYQRVEQGQPLTVADVKALARASVGDDIIISQIQSTRTVYHLSAAEIIELRDAGVSQRVIQFMINTGNTTAVPAPQPEIVYVPQAPPPPPYETVVVAPAPGYVWCGGEWAWSGRWVWHGGRWVAPPRHGVVWVTGGWVHESHGWRHAPGHWR
jgi:outer membrane lipoprotein SlyB